MEFNEILEGLFWFIAALIFADLMCLGGLFTEAIAKRISGDKKDEK